MSKLLECKGKMYEKGKYYFMFANIHTALEGGSVEKLHAIDGTGNFYGGNREYPHCIELTLPSMLKPVECGKITDKPFEPEVGKLYEFSDDEDFSWAALGVYRFMRDLEYSERSLFCTSAQTSYFYCRPIPVDRRPKWGE
jgi:hypothetical protein